LVPIERRAARREGEYRDHSQTPHFRFRCARTASGIGHGHFLLRLVFLVGRGDEAVPY
jgi:hypothetical protein